MRVSRKYWDHDSLNEPVGLGRDGITLVDGGGMMPFAKRIGGVNTHERSTDGGHTGRNHLRWRT